MFIEGESRKVGQVYLPQTLAQAMKQGRLVLLTASLQTRIDRILAEYFVDSQETQQKIDQILLSFRKVLGKESVANLRKFLKKWSTERIYQNFIDILL